MENTNERETKSYARANASHNTVYAVRFAHSNCSAPVGRQPRVAAKRCPKLNLPPVRSRGCRNFISQNVMENLVKFRDQLNIVLHASMRYDEAFRRYEEIIHQAQLLSRELRESLRRH